jgi:hypothetical protein
LTEVKTLLAELYAEKSGIVFIVATLCAIPAHVNHVKKLYLSFAIVARNQKLQNVIEGWSNSPAKKSANDF